EKRHKKDDRHWEYGVFEPPAGREPVARRVHEIRQRIQAIHPVQGTALWSVVNYRSAPHECRREKRKDVSEIQIDERERQHEYADRQARKNHEWYRKDAQHDRRWWQPPEHHPCREHDPEIDQCVERGLATSGSEYSFGRHGCLTEQSTHPPTNPLW